MLFFLRYETFACFADYSDIGQTFVQINKTLIISETRRERDFPRETSKIVMLKLVFVITKLIPAI